MTSYKKNSTLVPFWWNLLIYRPRVVFNSLRTRLKIGNGIYVTLTAFIEVVIRIARQKVEWWKKLNSRQKYAYVIGELLGIIFGIAFFAALGWVNGRIAQNLYIGFLFGALIFGPDFGKRLSQRYGSCTASQA